MKNHKSAPTLNGEDLRHDIRHHFAKKRNRKFLACDESFYDSKATIVEGIKKQLNFKGRIKVKTDDSATKSYNLQLDKKDMTVTVKSYICEDDFLFAATIAQASTQASLIIGKKLEAQDWHCDGDELNLAYATVQAGLGLVCLNALTLNKGGIKQKLLTNNINKSPLLQVSLNQYVSLLEEYLSSQKIETSTLVYFLHSDACVALGLESKETALTLTYKHQKNENILLSNFIIILMVFAISLLALFVLLKPRPVNKTQLLDKQRVEATKNNYENCIAESEAYRLAAPESDSIAERAIEAKTYECAQIINNHEANPY